MSNDELLFEQIPVNPKSTRNFSYLIGCPNTKQGLFVDPAFEPERFLGRIKKHDLTLDYILNTHGHRDHTSANQSLRRATGARVANHPENRVESDEDLTHEDQIEIGNLHVKVFHTPGHSEGSCSFLVNEDRLLTGDTLFVGKVGGTSNDGPDARQQYESIHNVLMQFPDHVRIYPGHDYGPKPHSTIGWEKENNPFVMKDSFESFCRLKKNWDREKKKWEKRWEDQVNTSETPDH